MKNRIKCIFYLVLCLYYPTLTACPEAKPISSSEFCHSFDVAAQCYCVNSGLTKKMCSSTDKVYKRMISVFGSVENACAYQHNTTYQKCIDNWHCYMQGGSTASNEWCSGTGASCV